MGTLKSFAKTIGINVQCRYCAYELTDSDLKNKEKILTDKGILRCPQCENKIRATLTKIPPPALESKINGSPNVNIQQINGGFYCTIKEKHQYKNAFLTAGLLSVGVFLILFFFKDIPATGRSALFVFPAVWFLIGIFSKSLNITMTLFQDGLRIKKSLVFFEKSYFEKSMLFSREQIQSFDVEESNHSRTGETIGRTHIFSISIRMRDNAEKILFQTPTVEDAIVCKKILNQYYGFDRSVVRPNLVVRH